jgi:hypothetical protein
MIRLSEVWQHRWITIIVFFFILIFIYIGYYITRETPKISWCGVDGNFIMDRDDFYIHLPSNVARSYPNQMDNTVANFVTNLAQKQNLSGDWEVGLVEMSYTKSWYNLPEDQKVGIFVLGEELPRFLDNSSIPAGHYDDTVNLLKLVDKELSMYSLSKDKIEVWPKLFYNTSTRKVRIDPGWTDSLKYLLPILDKELETILGLPIINADTIEAHGSGYISITGATTTSIDNVTKIHGVRTVDLSAGINSLYVYCNLLEPMLVGDVYAKLLRQVEIPNGSKFGDQCEIRFDTPYYHPLVVKEFDRIEIDIRDDSGKQVPFEFGRSSVTLHFRKRQNGTESIRNLLS